ncbi:hypothetical protein [Paraburkholderia sp. Cpub6]|uniref:hypothetical protein n=1 Tax=Paraburkholderia sp. Cpub6 TaxID=2723094 RepID=UPI00160CD67E|nr:hypothetical protein [Paraburkholderia sp. Cpub6]MBB5463788.1 hypothetical protein [Paraburkholderia sp. Cpub6]
MQKKNIDEAAYDKRINDLASNEYFQVLGYGRADNGVKFVMHKRERRILRMKPRQFSKPRLLHLAPLQWWRAHFPTLRNAAHSFDELHAVDFLFRACERAGEFDEFSTGVAE